MTKKQLARAVGNLDISKKNKDKPIPGILGFTLGGVNVVEVPTRLGFVYVRLRNSTNELIQAYNDQVSPVYNLPVLVIRDDVDKSRYKIVGRDLGVYQNWGSSSPYLPRHGNTHSFNPEGSGGGDTVFVYSRQMMPLAVYPSGTTGAGLVMISPHAYNSNSQWFYAGGVASSSLLPYKPTGSNARMVLLYLDENANPQLLGGSTYFNASLTGTSDILQYMPSVTDSRFIPLAGIRLLSGTSVILWDNIYDIRLWISPSDLSTGSFALNSSAYITVGNDSTLSNERALTAGAGISIVDNGANSSLVISFTGSVGGGVSVPTYPAVYDDSIFKATGVHISFDQNLYVINTGSSVFVSVSTGVFSPANHLHPGLSEGLLIYDNGIFKGTGIVLDFGDNLNVIASGTSIFVSSVDTGGGGGSNLLLYENGLFKVTGTAISFDNNFFVSVTGTTAYININPIPQSFVVDYDTENQLHIIETGTVIRINEIDRVTSTGSTIFIDLDAPLSIDVYDDSINLGSVSSFSFDNNLILSVSGVFAYVSSSIAGGAGGGIAIYDDGIFKATGTIIDFGNNINVVVSGTTVFVSSVDTGGGGGGSVLIYDDTTFISTGSSLSFQGNLGAAVTGSYTYIYDEDLDRQVVFTVENSLAVAVGGIRIPNRSGRARTLLGVYLDIGTPPTINSVIVDVNKGITGSSSPTTIFTNQANRPAIITGTYMGFSAGHSVINWGVGEYLTMDVDQIGSGTAGSNLTVTVAYR